VCSGLHSDGFVHGVEGAARDGTGDALHLATRKDSTMRLTTLAALAIHVTAATATVARTAHADPPAVVAPAAPTTAPTLEYKAPIVRPYEGGVIPEGAHLETRWNKEMFTVGVAVTAAAYLPSLLYAMETCGLQGNSDGGPPITGSACRSGSTWLYVPVIGPFVTAAQAPTTGGATLSVFDGVVQTAGAALMLAAVIAPRTVVVWQDLARSTSVRVTPVASAGGAGVAVTVTSL
jgi:hypothetical protein